MSGNVTLIQDIYAAFTRGDVGSILERVAPDVDWRHTEAPGLPYGGARKGREAVGRFFADIAGAIDVTGFEAATFATSGDDVYTTGWWAGVAKATGRSFRTQWAMRFTVAAGKVTFAQVWEDSALTAAALR